MDYKEALKGLGVDSSQVIESREVETPLEFYLRNSSEQFIELMKEKIKKEDAIGSWSLYESLNSVVEESGDGLQVRFDSEEFYAIIRDEGISGTERRRDTPFSFKTDHPSKAMAQDIQMWMKAKGITPPAGMTDTSMSWAIATNILKYGYEGADYVNYAFSDSNLSQFEEGILQLLENIVLGKFEKIIPEFK